jgi:hypothetical protein
MAGFNLQDYETVEERHARVLRAYPDLRCVIVNHTTAQDRQASTWVVEARVYLNAEDQAATYQKLLSGLLRLMVRVWLTKQVPSKTLAPRPLVEV